LLGLLRLDDLDDPRGESRECCADLAHDRDRGAHRGEAHAERDGGQGLAGLALARRVEDLGHIDLGQGRADRRRVDHRLEAPQELRGVVVELRGLGAEVCGQVKEQEPSPLMQIAGLLRGRGLEAIKPPACANRGIEPGILNILVCWKL
jgi:hypothetical protein